MEGITEKEQHIQHDGAHDIRPPVVAFLRFARRHQANQTKKEDVKEFDDPQVVVQFGGQYPVANDEPITRRTRVNDSGCQQPVKQQEYKRQCRQ